MKEECHRRETRAELERDYKDDCRREALVERECHSKVEGNGRVG